MLLSIFKSIRPLNLFVIVLTFFVLYQLDSISREVLPKSYFLKLFNLKVLALSTILVAAAGYLINDYYDKAIDAINKPKQKNKISDNVLISSYIVLNTVAIISSYSIDIPIGLFWVIPGSIFLLWMYSFNFKKIAFIGNISIAVLSAAVPMIYFIAMDLNHTDCQDSLVFIKSNELILVFVALAFVSTLGREIIKDIEDMKGDKNAGLKTIPILLGIKTAKVFSIFFLLCTLFIVAVLAKNYAYYNFSMTSLICLFILGVFPLLIAVSKTYQGSQIKQFTQASNLIKLGMFGFLTFIYLHAITL